MFPVNRLTEKVRLTVLQINWSETDKMAANGAPPILHVLCKICKLLFVNLDFTEVSGSEW